MIKHKIRLSFLLAVISSFIMTNDSITQAVVAPPSQIAPSDGTTNVTTCGTNITVTPSNISHDGAYALSQYSQFNLLSGDKAIMVLPTGVNYYINRMDSTGNPFNINGNLETRLGSSTGIIGGHLVFISPNGIYMGPNAHISTGSLTATTAATTRIMTIDNIPVNLNEISPANFGSINLKSMSDNTNVITFENIASSTNSKIINNGTIQTKTYVLNPEISTINLIGGSIENNRTIGSADSIVNFEGLYYSYQTNIINLTTAKKVTYSASAIGEFNLDEEINETNKMGSIYLNPDSITQGSEVSIKSFAKSPTSNSSSGSMDNTAINIEGKVKGNGFNLGLETYPAHILINSMSSGSPSINIGGNNSKIQTNGSNSDISIIGKQVYIAGNNLLAPIDSTVSSSGNINVLSSDSANFIDNNIIRASNDINIKNDSGTVSFINTNPITHRTSLLASGKITVQSPDIRFKDSTLNANNIELGANDIQFRDSTLNANSLGINAQNDINIHTGTNLLATSGPINIHSKTGINISNATTTPSTTVLQTDGDINLLTDDGPVNISGLEAGAVSLTSNAGNINIKSLKETNTNGGKIRLTGDVSLIASNNITFTSEMPARISPNGNNISPTIQAGHTVIQVIKPPEGVRKVIIIPQSQPSGPMAAPSPPPAGPSGQPPVESTSTDAKAASNNSPEQSAELKSADTATNPKDNEKTVSDKKDDSPKSQNDNGKSENSKPQEQSADKDNGPKEKSNDMAQNAIPRNLESLDETKLANFYGKTFVDSMNSNSSKKNEYTADSSAVDDLAATGYHPVGLAGFLITVKTIEDNSKLSKGTPNSLTVNSIFAYRHPKTLDRIKRVKGELDLLKAEGKTTGIVNKQKYNQIMSSIKTAD